MAAAICCSVHRVSTRDSALSPTTSNSAGVNGGGRRGRFGLCAGSSGNGTIGPEDGAAVEAAAADALFSELSALPVDWDGTRRFGNGTISSEAGLLRPGVLAVPEVPREVHLVFAAEPGLQAGTGGLPQK
eukprot:CAMPEP_0119345904 /NCGR_PEP_ID=MMETSP1333-20130426/107730_1 /TAXON_ID=418940 /ORGANISM="Scyphosphaera apsteinii, Strain RCC1455" /LENGTH=129 /DNA_ID=CAMNT_0007358393 /DNA_START=764 /DNA_END=1150 /DNA_ORIENTATION=+